MSSWNIASKRQDAGYGRGEQLIILVVTAIYVFVNKTFEAFNLSNSLPFADFDVGIILIASSGIIFGKKIGGISGTLGPLASELGIYLETGVTAVRIDLSLLISAGAIGVGAWITGFLTNDYRMQKINSAKGLVSKEILLLLFRSTLSAMIGISLIKNILFVFGSELQEGVHPSEGIETFLVYFLTDAFLIILLVPAVLIFFMSYEIYLQKAEYVKDLLMRDLEVNIAEMGKAEIVSVEIVDHPITVGMWSPIRVKFKSLMEVTSIFTIEAVANAKITPTFDRTDLLDPGSIWTQMFYVLPAKQKKVSVRIRILPFSEKEYKKIEEDDTIIEFESKTKNPNTTLKKVAGFGGINIGVVSLSMIGEKVSAFLSNPSRIYEIVKTNANLLATTIAIEIGIIASLLTWTFYTQKKKINKNKLKLTFSTDTTDHQVLGRKKTRLRQVLEKYGERLIQVQQIVLVLTSMGFVVFLAFQAYLVTFEGSPSIQERSSVFWAILAVTILWIATLKGNDILNELQNVTDKSRIPDGKLITRFQPLTELVEEETAVIQVKCRNPSSLPGIRLVFEAHDTVTPSLVELHVDPHEEAEFKISITPQKSGDQQLLVLGYPLFDLSKNYIPPDVAEPFEEQVIYYTVMNKTLGISKAQRETANKLVILSGFVAIIYSLVGQILPLPDFTSLSNQQVQLLAGIQAPLLYIYYVVRNRVKAMEAF